MTEDIVEHTADHIMIPREQLAEWARNVRTLAQHAIRSPNAQDAAETMAARMASWSEVAVTPRAGTDDDLYERLAAIQHDIWSHWMRYLLGTRLQPWEDGTSYLTDGDVHHWSRQMNTPYADLTEAEKASDREQVDRFWHLISGGSGSRPKAQG